MVAAILGLIPLSICCLSSPGSPGGGPAGSSSPDSLRALAHAYYTWRDSSYPVAASDQGLHTWDDRLTDYRPASVASRNLHVRELLARVKGTSTDGWGKDDRIDWYLFRAQLEGADFFPRVTRPEESDPQLYVNEIANGIFSLLKKEYAPRRTRALAAASRLEHAPAMLALARSNLKQPVRLFAQLAIAAARGGDELYTKSLMTLADSLSGPERERLIRARDSALAAIHQYADWLESRLRTMPAWKPMGKANYEYLLEHVLLLPLGADQVAMLGEAELARYRGLEAMLKDPSLASPDPARSANIPKDQAAFLSAYESRLREIVSFLSTNRLVTLPPYLGPFLIRQLPEAFKPTSPGGFMNPPGIYDKDPSGFYFIPTYNPKSGNFYIRAAIEDPRRSWDTREFPATSSSSPSPTTCPMRSAGSTPTACSSRAGRSMGRRC
jgi:uncharacterized protein (DUF885 family)